MHLCEMRAASPAGSGSCSHLYFARGLLGYQRPSCCWCCCVGRSEEDVEKLLTETVVKTLLSLRWQRRPRLHFDATRFSLAFDAERPRACHTPSYTPCSWHCRSNVAESSRLPVLHEQGVILCFFGFVFLCFICFSKPACYLLSWLPEHTHVCQACPKKGVCGRHHFGRKQINIKESENHSSKQIKLKLQFF